MKLFCSIGFYISLSVLIAFSQQAVSVNDESMAEQITRLIKFSNNDFLKDSEDVSNKMIDFDKRISGMNNDHQASIFLGQNLKSITRKNSEFLNVFKHSLVDLKVYSISSSVIKKFESMKFSWLELFNMSKANVKLANEIMLRSKYLHNTSKNTLPVAVCICKNDFTQQEICKDKNKASQYFMDAKSFLLNNFNNAI